MDVPERKRDIPDDVDDATADLLRALARCITETSAARGVDIFAIDLCGLTAGEWAERTGRHRTVPGQNAAAARESISEAAVKSATLAACDDAAEDLLATVARCIAETTAAQGVDYAAVVECGVSRHAWARLTDRDRTTVRKNVNRAETALSDPDGSSNSNDD